MLSAGAPLPAAAIASPHADATRTGRDVLAAGGNALDACVAANAMLGVVYPHMCGPGGDLFLLYHHGRTGTIHALNASGPAPRLASVEALRVRGHRAVPARGPLSVTVPGAVAGWAAGLERFGTLPLGDLLEPAARAAQAGTTTGERLAGWIAGARGDLARDPALRRTFLDATGAPLPAGAQVRQPALAATLRRLGEAGARDLYRGDLAAEVDRASRAAGGLLRAADLAAFAPEWVAPIRARHRGVEVVTTPPNSQGFAALLMLRALRGDAPPGSAEHVDALAAKRAAFAARERHMADPRFAPVAVDYLLAREPVAGPPAGGDTVYVCAVDHDGNACSLIQSIFYGFGACFVAGESGILLHNRGHAFAVAPGHPNRLEPGKRPGHTLMACMAIRDGRLAFVLGTMGAEAQPQVNVQVLERLLAGQHPAEAVGAPRVVHGRHHLEDDPDLLRCEADLGAPVIERLRAIGHRVEVVGARDERMGHAHAIALTADGTLLAGADPRSDGSAETA